MQNGIQKIEKIIEYIENNITSDMNYEEMASIMTLSVYEFRRILIHGVILMEKVIRLHNPYLHLDVADYLDWDYIREHRMIFLM